MGIEGSRSKDRSRTVRATRHPEPGVHCHRSDLRQRSRVAERFLSARAGGLPAAGPRHDDFRSLVRFYRAARRTGGFEAADGLAIENDC